MRQESGNNLLRPPLTPRERRLRNASTLRTSGAAEVVGAGFLLDSGAPDLVKAWGGGGLFLLGSVCIFAGFAEEIRVKGVREVVRGFWRVKQPKPPASPPLNFERL